MCEAVSSWGNEEGGLLTLNSCQTRQVACDERAHFAALPPFSSRAASAAAGAAGAAGTVQQLGGERGREREEKWETHPRIIPRLFSVFFPRGEGRERRGGYAQLQLFQS